MRALKTNQAFSRLDQGSANNFLVRPLKNCLEFTRPKNFGSVIFAEYYIISNTNFKATIKCSNFLNCRKLAQYERMIHCVYSISEKYELCV